MSTNLALILSLCVAGAYLAFWAFVMWDLWRTRRETRKVEVVERW